MKKIKEQTETVEVSINLQETLSNGKTLQDQKLDELAGFMAEEAAAEEAIKEAAATYAQALKAAETARKSNANERLEKLYELVNKKEKQNVKFDYYVDEENLKIVKVKHGETPTNTAGYDITESDYESLPELENELPISEFRIKKNNGNGNNGNGNGNNGNGNGNNGNGNNGNGNGNNGNGNGNNGNGN